MALHPIDAAFLERIKSDRRFRQWFIVWAFVITLGLVFLYGWTNWYYVYELPHRRFAMLHVTLFLYGAFFGYVARKFEGAKSDA